MLASAGDLVSGGNLHLNTLLGFLSVTLVLSDLRYNWGLLGEEEDHQVESGKGQAERMWTRACAYLPAAPPGVCWMEGSLAGEWEGGMFEQSKGWGGPWYSTWKLPDWHR